jgi:arginase
MRPGSAGRSGIVPGGAGTALAARYTVWGVQRILVPYHIDEYLPDLDVPVDPDLTVHTELTGGDPWARMAVLYEQVAGAVADAAGSQRPVTVVSGDCTTALGTVAGLQRAGVDAGIVWFDAHGDVQTLETSTSGYLGGVPLRILAGYRPELISHRIGLRAVAEERVTLVDARDLDPAEAEYLAASAIRRCTVADVSADTLPAGPLYLHVDLDIIDPAELPGLRFPAPGGPGPAPVDAAIGRVLATGRVAALGLACTWHPGRDCADRLRPALTATLASAQ